MEGSKKREREPPPEKLLSARQVAGMLGVTPLTLRRWVMKGDFPRPIVFSSHVHRWRLSDVQEHAGSPIGEKVAV